MAATEVNAQVVDDLTITNVKTIAGTPAQLNNLLMAHQISHSKRLDMLAELGLGEQIGQRSGHDVGEAAGMVPVQGANNVLVQALAEVVAKIAGLTPPVTATGV
jgi:hypothetical protein